MGHKKRGREEAIIIGKEERRRQQHIREDIGDGAISESAEMPADNTT